MEYHCPNKKKLKTHVLTRGDAAAPPGQIDRRTEFGSCLSINICVSELVRPVGCETGSRVAGPGHPTKSRPYPSTVSSVEVRVWPTNSYGSHFSASTSILHSSPPRFLNAALGHDAFRSTLHTHDAVSPGLLLNKCTVPITTSARDKEGSLCVVSLCSIDSFRCVLVGQLYSIQLDD
jgi:hypothetical protein